jgi:Mg2+ and Co2+ transporter CorA
VSVTIKSLPFDERNQRDFEEITERIRTALDAIRKSKSLKPTQSTLARLAQCSRRTLSLRRWPIEELKRIKANRNPDGAESEISSPTRKVRTNQNEAQLIAQIRNYQDQNGRLFDRVQGLEEEKARSALVQKSLEDQLTVSAERVRELEKEIRMTKLKLVEATSTGEGAAPSLQQI